MNDASDKHEQDALHEVEEVHKKPWTPTPEELANILSGHAIWLETDGREGQKANLQRAELQKANLQKANLQKANLRSAFLIQAQLQDADLSDAQLQRAHLTEAQLQGAWLKDAQLQGADLHRAQLHGANLHGAQLQGANLRRVNMQGDIREVGRIISPDGEEVIETTGHEAADLSGCDLRGADLTEARFSFAKGLQSRALGGANLLRGSIPKEIAEFRALGTVADISARARGLFLASIAACLYSWLTIATTTDVDLITNTTSTPLPIIQTKVPIAWFYWVAPGILLSLFVYLHLYLQRLWEALASLPAIFPSGRALHEEAYPWLLSSLILAFVPRLKEQRPTLWWLQVSMSFVAGWVVVPFTIFGYWARFLPRHDWPGTFLIVIAIVLSVGMSVTFWRRARVTLRDGDTAKLGRAPFIEAAAASVVLLVAATVSVLAFGGEERFEFGPIRGYADLTDADLSARPTDWWKLTDEQKARLKGVTGAKLFGIDLRFSRASGAFLALANLRGGASLESGDFIDANFQGAKLYGTNFEKAILVNANFKDADLRATNFRETNTRWAKFQGANFARAQLQFADLKNTNLQQVNFRLANLKGVDLKAANLQGADLREVMELAQPQLDVACGDKDTKLPEGLVIKDCPKER